MLAKSAIRSSVKQLLDEVRQEMIARADDYSSCLIKAGRMAYPVTIHVDPSLHNKNRWTTAFRPLLAIPHAIVVGPIARLSGDNSPGLLTMVAYFLGVVSWFTIL